MRRSPRSRSRQPEPALMNCQDHLYRHTDPALVSRRWFLEQCGVGLGTMALGQLLSEAGYASPTAHVAGAQPTGAPAASLRPQGQARDLPVHGRRAQPSGALRQQAPAREVRRHAAARPSCSRAIARRSSIPTPSCWARSSSSPGTASAAPSSPSCCRTWPGSSMTWPSSRAMSTDAFNHAPGQIMMSTGVA